MTTAPNDLRVLTSLQFISALIAIPISFLMGVQKIALIVLGEAVQSGTDLMTNAALLNQGAIALLSVVTFCMGIVALYLSLSIQHNNLRFALYGTMITQAVLCGAELAKFGLGVRGNLLTILLAIAILGYLYKPQWASIAKSFRQGTFRFPQSLQLDSAQPNPPQVPTTSEPLDPELAQQND
ncbi:hypothetical protein [Spirulina major]|uniref:hypothetical protein n=1 Tax=Spirulina major TaxID=270636 RepID=UPI000933E4F5|nr:hypothetical protein [Spirulina major]